MRALVHSANVVLLNCIDVNSHNDLGSIKIVNLIVNVIQSREQAALCQFTFPGPIDQNSAPNVVPVINCHVRVILNHFPLPDADVKFCQASIPSNSQDAVSPHCKIFKYMRCFSKRASCL